MRNITDSQINGPFGLEPQDDEGGKLEFRTNFRLFSPDGPVVLVDNFSTLGRRFQAEHIDVNVNYFGGDDFRIGSSARGPLVRKDGSLGMSINSQGVYLNDIQKEAVKRAALEQYRALIAQRQEEITSGVV